MRADEALDKGLRTPFDRLYMRFPRSYPTDVLSAAAEDAAAHARWRAPKSSGVSSGRIQPIWGEDFFGLRWTDKYVWFQEMGIRPFVMNSLQGKTIPMWVDDHDGAIRRDNPKTKVRTTADGRVQALIFRKAAHKGERKTVRRTIGGIEQYITVPRSYPGAPGRINARRRGTPFTTGGAGGQIGRGNQGVRWRHPGLSSRFFLHEAILLGARTNALPTMEIHVAPMGTVI